MTHTILRLPAVLRERGRSRSSHYADIQQGLFTHPVLLGLRSVGWPADEVAAINAARIAGKTDDEIRALVTQLETARRAVDLNNSDAVVVAGNSVATVAPDADRLGRCAAAAGMPGAGAGEGLYVPVTRKVSLKREQKACCAG